MSYICDERRHCVVYVDSVDEFVNLVLGAREIRRFVGYVSLVDQLFRDNRYDWSSTHASLDRWIIQLSKVIKLSEEACRLWTPGGIVNCYALFHLSRLEDAVKLAKEFRDETKRIRRMIHNTINYVVSTVFDDIIYSRAETRLHREDVSIMFTHYFNSRELEITAYITIDDKDIGVMDTLRLNLRREYEILSKRVNMLRARELLGELVLKRTLRYANRLRSRVAQKINP